MKPDYKLLDSLKASGLWGFRTSNEGVSYGGFRRPDIGVWAECPNWTDAATCDGGGFFCQGPGGYGYAHGGETVEFVETRVERKIIGGNKIAAREMRWLYTGQDAIDALMYVCDGRFEGSLWLKAPLDLSNCDRVGGDVRVREGSSLDLSNCERVGGGVQVYKGASVDLSKCECVGGYVWADEGASVDLSNCKSVGGHVWVEKGAILDLSNCKRVGGNVQVDEGASVDLSKCKSVDGCVRASKGANISMPKRKQEATNEA